MSALPPKADMSSAAAIAVSSYPFFAGREGRSPSVPIWSEVDTRTHILNKDIAKHRALLTLPAAPKLIANQACIFDRLICAHNSPGTEWHRRTWRAYKPDEYCCANDCTQFVHRRLSYSGAAHLK